MPTLDMIARGELAKPEAVDSLHGAIVQLENHAKLGRDTSYVSRYLIDLGDMSDGWFTDQPRGNWSHKADKRLGTDINMDIGVGNDGRTTVAKLTVGDYAKPVCIQLSGDEHEGRSSWSAVFSKGKKSWEYGSEKTPPKYVLKTLANLGLDSL